MNVYSMLTTTPNELVKPIHPTRMPVILDPDNYEHWLTGSSDETAKLLKPYPPDQMRIALEGGKADEV
jgi:putative SOS response-associated peptidase YedK